MKKEKNIFGEGNLYEAEDIKGKIYVRCTACMSIYAEFLSWANANPNRIAKNPDDADSIIVLGCQVTDLAVLNDLRHLRMLKDVFGGTDFYIGGCLARRFDIDVEAKRLGNVRRDYQQIKDRSLVDYAAPFWVKNFVEGYGDGNLFRGMYPLRIGVGCGRNCKYCTIKTTRGTAYKLDSKMLSNEFVDNKDVVLISESPSAAQIIEWTKISRDNYKSISIRNLEPIVAKLVENELINLSERGLLKVLHVPVQSLNKFILSDMNRDVESTLRFVDSIERYRGLGVFTATNVIIDYKNFENSLGDAEGIFDHVAWNPYWDGNWDEDLATERFVKYI